MKEVVPYIAALDLDEKTRKDVLVFLANTDQFFLNIMMAAGYELLCYGACIVSRINHNQCENDRDVTLDCSNMFHFHRVSPLFS